MRDFTGSLDLAQYYLDSHDPGMAAYVLRDLAITEQAELTDLMWAAYRHGCVHSDIQPVVKTLRALNAKSLEAPC